MNTLTIDQNEQICQLVLSAGQRAVQLRNQSFQIFEKGINDYVTDVDRVLDQFLSRGLQAIFPEDGMITEENSHSRPAFQANYSRLWLIDPIDGTAEYIQQGSGYAVMLGLLENYVPQAGWVYAPARKRLFWGGPGWGVFYADDGAWPQALAVYPPQSGTEKPCPMLLGYRDHQRFSEVFAQYIPLHQCCSLGSFGLKVLEVIQGNAGLYLYLNGRVKLWDTVGPIAMAQAAGLTCCDLKGQPLVFTPAAIDLDSLTLRQSIIIGWPDYVDSLLPKVRLAVAQVGGWQ